MTWLFLSVGHPPNIVQVLLALVVTVAAIWDVRQHRVPNWLTLSALLAGIGLNAFLFEIPGLWSALEGLGLAFLIYFPLYLLRGMGAGDVKLMAAVGAIVGPAPWLRILVLTSLVGALAAIALIAAKGRFRKTLENIWMILLSIRYGTAPYHGNPQLDVGSGHGLRLPHAVVIACGAIGFLAGAAIWAPR